MQDSKQLDLLEKQAFIFGSLFLLANKLQVTSDQYLEKSGLTTKQWFLIAAIERFADTAPTLSQVSELIGSSRQNVKQLALKLEKKEFLKLEQDNKAIRLVLTAKCRAFWRERKLQDKHYIVDILKYLSEAEIGIMAESIKKVLTRVDEVIRTGDK